MIVVAMIVDGMIVMRIRSMGIASTHLAVMLDGIAARIARMRAENRDQPGDYSADQWQKHDCLDHRRASLRMISVRAKSFVREHPRPAIRQSQGMLFRI